MLRLCEKNGRQFRNLIGPAQLLDLALKRTQTLVLGGGHAIAGPSVDLVSLNPVKQRLGGGSGVDSGSIFSDDTFQPNTSTVHFEFEFLNRGAVEMPGQPSAHGAPAHQFVGQEWVEVMNAVDLSCRGV